MSDSDSENVTENDYEFDSAEGETEDEPVSWIAWFCSLVGHEFFCEVDESFIEDEFNLTDAEMEDEDSVGSAEQEMIDTSADTLYGLIHARYIITTSGLRQMAIKYENGEFGTCARYLCKGTHLLPCGLSDNLDVDSVKLFCPSCLDIYNPLNSRFYSVDGAFFGTTFPHLFFETFQEYWPTDSTALYIPKIFGFSINERSNSGSRSKWLRMIPPNSIYNNLDEEMASSEEEDGERKKDGDPDQEMNSESNNVATPKDTTPNSARNSYRPQHSLA
ncbi:putative casein kinase II subunit beta-2 [Zancudomyces culisetae]|uniref:Casein kinase II subunit beta n=1 Tax=Zancudomyces culisetae TaxID=1213189 RepID=A0A1R1PPR8_ZANCU|nr:putative casein kinase II subunit beta-2 [Zancudomyces culisetae]|eukprot:OMH82957.1 putative casein kinase II subunit beta-2 [Zancudomyces culisetae]